MSAPPPPISESHHSGSRSAVLEGVLRALWRLVQGLRLYGVDHPASKSAAAEAALESTALGTTGTDVPMLHVAPDGFVLNGHALVREAALTDLARTLHDLRVGLMSVPTRSTPEAFIALAAVLAGKKAGEHWTDEDSLSLSASAASAFGIRKVSYDALRSVGAEAGAGPDRFDWNALVASLCPDSGQANADELAHAIELTLSTKDHLEAAPPSASPGQPDGARPEAPDRPRPESGSASIAGQLARTIQSADQSHRQAAVTRVSAVIERLSPEGRARLLEIDESRAAESLAAVSDLCDSADAGDILLALQRVSNPRKLVCAESVRLLAKIAVTARGNTGINGGLRHIASRAVSAGTPAGDPRVTTVLRSFQELIERTSADRFNPEDYERLLQQLGSASAPVASHHAIEDIRGRWTDPCLHSSNLLTDLAESDLTNVRDAAGIYQRLHGAFEAIARSGTTSLFLRALRAGYRFRDLAGSSDTISALDRFALGLRSPDRVRSLLAGAPPGTESGRAAMELIAELGTESASAALSLCSGDLVRPDVFDLPVHPSVDTEKVMRHLVSTDAAASIRILRARVLPVRAQGALAVAVSDNPDADVSADAFECLYACEPARFLERLPAVLEHRHERVRVMGLDVSRKLDPAPHRSGSANPDGRSRRSDLAVGSDRRGPNAGRLRRGWTSGYRRDLRRTSPQTDTATRGHGAQHP